MLLLPIFFLLSFPQISIDLARLLASIVVILAKISDSTMVRTGHLIDWPIWILTTVMQLDGVAVVSNRCAPSRGRHS